MGMAIVIGMGIVMGMGWCWYVPTVATNGEVSTMALAHTKLDTTVSSALARRSPRLELSTTMSDKTSIPLI